MGALEPRGWGVLPTKAGTRPSIVLKTSLTARVMYSRINGSLISAAAGIGRGFLGELHHYRPSAAETLSFLGELLEVFQSKCSRRVMDELAHIFWRNGGAVFVLKWPGLGVIQQRFRG